MTGSPLALIFFVAYLAVVFGIGIYCRKYSNDLTGFLVGNRNMGPWMLGLAYFATYMSSTVMVGNAGTSYKAGMAFMFQGIPQILAIPVGLIIFASGLSRASKQLDVISVPDYLKKRYKSNLPSAFLALMMLIFLFPYMVGIAKAAAITMQMVTGLSYVASVWILCILTGVYMGFGGFMASAYTDVVQGFLMCFGATLVFIMGLVALGGPANVAATLQNLDPLLIETPGSLGWSNLIGISLVFGIAPWGLPQLLQKCFAMKDKRVIKPAAIIVMILCLFILFPSNCNGFLARAMFGNELLNKADYAFPMMVITLLPPVFQGLVLASVAAAAMSTLDGVVLVIGAAVGRDIYQGVINKKASDKQAYNITLITMCTVMVLIAVFAMNVNSQILYLTTFSHSIMASMIMAPVMFGLFWRKGTTAGCLAAQISGICGTLIWYQLGSPFGIHIILFGLICAFITFPIVSSFTKPLPEEFLDKLFDKKYKEFNWGRKKEESQVNA